MLQVILSTLDSLDSTEAPPEVTPEVAKMLALLEGEMTRAEIMQALGLKDEKNFRQKDQQVGISLGVIEMTIPDKPTNRLQKYRLTSIGHAWRRKKQQP